MYYFVWKLASFKCMRTGILSVTMRMRTLEVSPRTLRRPKNFVRFNERLADYCVRVGWGPNQVIELGLLHIARIVLPPVPPCCHVRGI